ncbi:cupin domain-containing protein [Pseudoponticoccus marisrubri]|uniref:Cupin n=1 Tax=Pseudoponticoccus marisrubri TaxID=1685382 RepID=A0A0W7WKP0_9RHOB|nr:cupin domain-containing protein [Pseudoponticoccus marisrubri]KUF11048.1 cupin [Pseudoponticoccus marisrubri]
MTIHRLDLQPGEGIPNNPSLPVLVAPGAVSGPPERICALMEANGWTGTWVWTVFDYHHFHPDAHEALVCASGTARLMLGGPGGPSLDLHPGDALLLPAGTGHKRLSQSPDFRICGAYPPGQSDYTTLREGQGGPDIAAQIAAVPLPDTDPLTGPDGPLCRLWHAPS